MRLFLFIIFAQLLVSSNLFAKIKKVRPSIYKDFKPGEDKEFKTKYHNETSFSLLGRDINNWFLKKKQVGSRKSSWFYQYFPVLYPSVDTGFNYGLRAMLYELSQSPYKYHVLAQYWGSDRGRAQHELKFVIANLFNFIHFRLMFKYDKSISSRFFGLGDSANNMNLTDIDSDTYISNTYYWYKIKRPSLNIFLGFNFLHKKLKLYTSAYFTNVSIEKYYQYNRSFINIEQPYGLNGGRFNYLKLGFLYDNKSEISNPDKGFLVDFAITRFGLFDSEYDFHSLDFGFAYFKSFPRYFTFASRLLFSHMFGDNIPFFAYGSFYLNDDIEALGGGDTLRGYQGGRFIDRIKTSIQFELRTRFYEAIIGDKRVEVDIVPFFDIGNTANSLKTYTLKNMNKTYGVSLRTIFNTRSVVKITLASCAEGKSLSFGFDEIFK